MAFETCNGFFKPVLKSMVYPKLRAELPSMSKKVVAITGTTSGMGFIAARTCAEKGASLVLLNRQSERSASALKKLKEEFPHSSIGMFSYEGSRLVNDCINEFLD